MRQLVTNVLQSTYLQPMEPPITALELFPKMLIFQDVNLTVEVIEKVDQMMSRLLILMVLIN
eukprot:15340824-Ditylum_brightwellii.AAC.1